ncbi:MAG: nucleotidyltransferase domain-containing protein [Chloroflexi bacterium]|nr:nucleotidyltransferase domain-containing protein [Chloroflexota bacterium]
MTPEVLQWVVEKIVQAVQPSKIILFGSYARETQTTASDLDLFIVYDGAESTRAVRRKIDLLLWGRRFGIDILVRRPEDVQRNLDARNPFYLYHIFGEGRVLYERE